MDRAGYRRQADLSYLELDNAKLVRNSAAAADVRLQKLRLNRYALEQLAAQRRALVKAVMVQTACAWAFTIVKTIGHVIPYAFVPRWRTIFRSLGKLLDAQARTSREAPYGTRSDYQAAKPILQARVKEFEKALGLPRLRRQRFRAFRGWRRLGR